MISRWAKEGTQARSNDTRSSIGYRAFKLCDRVTLGLTPVFDPKDNARRMLVFGNDGLLAIDRPMIYGPSVF